MKNKNFKIQHSIYTFLVIIFIIFTSISVSAGNKKAVMEISGMTCHGCIKKVKKEIDKVNGVISSNVTLVKAIVLVDSKKNVTEEILTNAVKNAGFTVSKFSWE